MIKPDFRGLASRVSCSFLLFVVIFWLATPAFSSDKFVPEPKAVFTNADAEAWERVELLEDPHPGFVTENYSTGGKQMDPAIVKWFQNCPTPPSRQFLLHCAKGFQGKTFPHPILLVHGAGDNANRAWIHPWDHLLPSTLPAEKQGFAYWLSNLGYSVFAITFAHNQGDNFMQAEHIANAITRIRHLLGRDGDPSFKVDVIAHSKGNVAARLYLSDAPSLFPKKGFLTPYRKDVGVYLGLAPAFRGIDTAFRYYGFNLQVADKSDSNAPLATNRMVFKGTWADFTPKTLFRDSARLWPGQAQLLFNLVRDANVPLGPESFTADANYSMLCLYFGGTSMFLFSRGIDEAINDGERLIYRLEEKGMDPQVQFAVIAGNKPFITYLHGGEVTPMPWELFTPSGDGLVYLASSLFTDNAAKRGAKLLGKKSIFLNHVEIAREKEVVRLIDDFLRDDRSRELKNLTAEELVPQIPVH